MFITAESNAQTSLLEAGTKIVRCSMVVMETYTVMNFMIFFHVSNKFNSATTRQTIWKQAKEEHIFVLVAAKIHDVPLTKELNARVRFEGKVNGVINRISISIDQDWLSM